MAIGKSELAGALQYAESIGFESDPMKLLDFQSRSSERDYSFLLDEKRYVKARNLFELCQSRSNVEAGHQLFSEIAKDIEECERIAMEDHQPIHRDWSLPGIQRFTEHNHKKVVVQSLLARALYYSLDSRLEEALADIKLCRACIGSTLDDHFMVAQVTGGVHLLKWLRALEVIGLRASGEPAILTSLCNDALAATLPDIRSCLQAEAANMRLIINRVRSGEIEIGMLVELYNESIMAYNDANAKVYREYGTPRNLRKHKLATLPLNWGRLAKYCWDSIEANQLRAYVGCYEYWDDIDAVKEVERIAQEHYYISPSPVARHEMNSLEQTLRCRLALAAITLKALEVRARTGALSDAREIAQQIGITPYDQVSKRWYVLRFDPDGVTAFAGMAKTGGRELPANTSAGDPTFTVSEKGVSRKPFPTCLC